MDIDDYTQIDDDYLLGHGATALGNINGDTTCDINDYNLIDAGYAAGTGNDPLALAPTYASYVDTPGDGLAAINPAPLCEFGHQGLMHDEEVGLIYDRARMLQPGLGRFCQRDPLGYVDGGSLYQYEGSSTFSSRDSRGLSKWDLGENRFFTAIFGTFLQQAIFARYDLDPANAGDFFGGKIWNNRAISTILKVPGHDDRPDIVHLSGELQLGKPSQCGTFNIYEIKPAEGAFASYDVGTGSPTVPGIPRFRESGIDRAVKQATEYGREFSQLGYSWALAPKGAPGTSGTLILGLVEISWWSPADGAIIYSVKTDEKNRSSIIARLRVEAKKRRIFIDPQGRLLKQPYEPKLEIPRDGNVESEVTPFLLAGSVYGLAVGGGSVVEATMAGGATSAGTMVVGGEAVTGTTAAAIAGTEEVIGGESAADAFGEFEELEELVGAGRD